MFKVGDIVRYNPEWCSENEKKLIHVVKEVGLYNPVTMQPTRVKIVTLNSGLFLPPVEVVEEVMIDGLGLSFGDIQEIAANAE